jgi:hypothetical protein
MTKSAKMLTLGFGYLIGIVILFVAGEGIAAAYLTFPGGLPVFHLIDLIPPNSALEAAVTSWTGNLVLLLLSAAVNVAGVYLVVRLLSAVGAGKRSAEEDGG